MKENAVIIEFGVLEEIINREGEDRSRILWPANPFSETNAFLTLATELEKFPYKKNDRETETGHSIKALRVIKKTTVITYECL